MRCLKCGSTDLELEYDDEGYLCGGVCWGCEEE
mgnify:FL=1